MNIFKDSPLSIYKGLPSPIYALFWATLINGIGIFVYPFLVLFLTQKLGYTDAQAGIFMTVTTTLYVPGSFLGSKLADKFGRKRVMLIAQLLASSMFIVCGFLGQSRLVPWFIMANLLFDGVCDPARSALQTDQTNFENRQASFSLTYLGHNLGFIIGPMVGGFLFYSAPNWLFWGNGIAGILAVLLVMWKVPESRPDAKEIEASLASDSTDKAERGGIIKALFSRPFLLIFALCQMFVHFAYSQTLFALPLTTTQLFGHEGATIYGSIMSLNGIVVVLLTPLTVSLLKRFNPLANIAVAGIFFTIGFSFLGLAFTPLAFYFLAILFTTGEVISATNVNYYIANNTPITHRARFAAIMPVIMGTGQAIAPMIGGAISEHSGLNSLWYLVGATSAIGTIGVFCLYLHERKKKRAVVPTNDVADLSEASMDEAQMGQGFHQEGIAELQQEESDNSK